VNARTEAPRKTWLPRTPGPRRPEGNGP
jgi:hypothetical protein